MDSQILKTTLTQWTHLRRFTIVPTSKLHVESLWKLHRFWKANPCGNYDIDSTFKIDEISMSSPRRFFYVVSTSNWRNFCSCCFYSIISWHSLLQEPILSYSGIVLSRCNSSNVGTISFGNFATTEINRSKDNFCFLQNNINKDYNTDIYKCKVILSRRFFVFKSQGLYYHELIFCKWVNLQKSRY